MPNNSVLKGLDWNEGASHYRQRAKTGAQLRGFLESRQVRQFAELAIGLSDATGNYSAAEHPKIRASIPMNLNWQGRVFNLATQFVPLNDAGQVPALIEKANLDYLKISVGSEISCMVNPQVCWVCNRRTIWTHLAWTRGFGEAEQLLEAFKQGDSDSEMAYSNWAAAFHPELGGSLREIAEEGGKLSLAASIPPGGLTFLWADAIASQAYDNYHQGALIRQP